jgi:hypothetical protein
MHRREEEADDAITGNSIMGELFRHGPYSDNESDLNLEQLKDYENSESEQFDGFLKKLKEGEIGPYPGPERFRRLSEPVAKRAAGVSIWPQIPIYGSLMVPLIVPLLPVREADFFTVHRFEAAELPRLVELCKDTGRVQFALAARPTQFAGLEYLDPVLSELRPPVVRAIPNAAVFDDASLRKTNLQFDTMANISMWPLIRANLTNAGLDHRHAEQNYDMIRSTYSMLKLLGYHKAVAEIDENMISDAPRAHRVLYLYNQFVQGPMFDPLKGIFCFSRDYIKDMKRVPGSETNSPTDQFPCEVGAFILSSLTLVPENMEACQNVIDRYEQEGVMRLVTDLSSAVADSKLDAMTSASAQLTSALQNVWDDLRNKNGTIAGVFHGMSLAMAAGGSAAGQLLAGSPGSATAMGLLSGLGFQLLDRGAESASDGTAAKTLSKSYTISVYNFEKKYRFDKP